jgi:hypothetical protein
MGIAQAVRAHVYRIWLTKESRMVIGDGKLVVPVDFAIRRPHPKGSGAPYHDKL